MTTSTWIRLDRDRIAPETVPSDATWAHESPSLYDIPTHARSTYDSSSGVFSIEFRYLSKEPLKSIELTRYLKADVGKKSNRLYAVHFDIHGFHRDKKAIADRTRTDLALSSIVEPNKDIAVRVITEQEVNLFAAIPPPQPGSNVNHCSI